MITQITLLPYKCFSKRVNIEPPKLVNLIIGKNNCGKTTLLDIFKTLYTQKTDNNKNISFRINISIEQNILDFMEFYALLSAHAFCGFPSKNELLNRQIAFDISVHNEAVNARVDNESLKNIVINGCGVRVISPINCFTKSVDRYDRCLKMAAERDITSEPKDNSAVVKSNGKGIVSKMLFYDTNKHGNRGLKENILNDLNEILKGECFFKSLNIIENDDGKYEINLIDSNNNEIPLSEMGSGIKTILHVSYILNNSSLLPNDNQVLMFEELENNLHPEVQRRLVEKIYKFAVDHNCKVFITTHSNTVINTLFEKTSTMVYHVYKDADGSSVVRTVSSAKSKKDVLNDLGVKASDIFQSNGIVWVEGPSDRIYLKKWMELINPELEENIHYTFLYYGGRLLSHYSGTGTAEESELIDIFLTNRNSAIVIDSDIDCDGKEINATKKRILQEFAKNDSFSWVTKGREIENYIHEDSINKLYPDIARKRIGTYEDFKDYISKSDPNFENHKVKMARSLAFTKDSLNVMDLNEKIISLVETIKKWNNN